MQMDRWWIMPVPSIFWAQHRLTYWNLQTIKSCTYQTRTHTKWSRLKTRSRSSRCRPKCNCVIWAARNLHFVCLVGYDWAKLIPPSHTTFAASLHVDARGSFSDTRMHDLFYGRHNKSDHVHTYTIQQFLFACLVRKCMWRQQSIRSMSKTVRRLSN